MLGIMNNGGGARSMPLTSSILELPLLLYIHWRRQPCQKGTGREQIASDPA